MDSDQRQRNYALRAGLVMKRFLSLLLLLLPLGLGGANCSPCMVNSVAVKDIYISSVSANGIAVGVDSANCGPRADPCLTADQGFTRVLSGTRFFFNGVSSGAPTVYTTTTGIPAGTYSINSVTDYSTILAGTGTTTALTVNIDTHVTINNLRIDPSQNSGGAAASCITLANNLTTASRMDLNLNGTIFQNWTGQCITAGNSRFNAVFTDAVFNGGTVSGAITTTGFATGTLTITGGSCTLTGQNLANLGGCIVILGGTASTATVSVTNFAASCTLSSALVGAGLHYCERYHDVVATVVGGSAAVLGAPGTRTGAAVYFTNVNNDTSGSSVTGLTATNTANGGYGCAAGGESIAAIPTITVSISCNVTGNTTSASNGLHCIFLGGNTQNSVVTGSTVTTCGLPFVNKLGTNNTFTNSQANGWRSTGGAYMKGATNPVMTNLTMTQNIATANQIGISIGDDTPGSGTHTTNATITGNHVVNNGGTNFQYVVVDPSNTFAGGSPGNNTYEFQAGSNSATEFSIGGVADYSSCASYKAGFEASATCVNLP